MKQPNFLIIQADQLTAMVLSMYGGKTVKTPNIDALANRGVTFLNSYCNNPVCGPSITRSGFSSPEAPLRNTSNLGGYWFVELATIAYLASWVSAIGKAGRAGV